MSPPTDRLLPLFSSLFTPSYQLIPPCIERSIKKLSWWRTRPFWMHWMCENAVKRGVVTGPPNQRKEGNGAFLVQGFLYQRSVASERLDTERWKVAQKIGVEESHILAGWHCYTSVVLIRDFTHITIGYFCNCNVADLSISDLCFLGWRIKRHSSILHSKQTHSFWSAY